MMSKTLPAGGWPVPLWSVQSSVWRVACARATRHTECTHGAVLGLQNVHTALRCAWTLYTELHYTVFSKCTIDCVTKLLWREHQCNLSGRSASWWVKLRLLGDDMSHCKVGTAVSCSGKANMCNSALYTTIWYNLVQWAGPHVLAGLHIRHSVHMALCWVHKMYGTALCTYQYFPNVQLTALPKFCHQIPTAPRDKSGEFETVHNEGSRPEVARLIHGLIHRLQLESNK